MAHDRAEDAGRRKVVIIGGGFGGLACARALGGADVDVTLIDRRNYHLFQPLLYQVSTAALSPADIAVPLRSVLSGARNVRVLLAEVAGIDTTARAVRLSDGDVRRYDQLVIATGAVYNYFGNDDWAHHAPAPKTIAAARDIRARLLGAFERAERCDDPAARAALLTFVVVGGGPTGVEIAGTVAELARRTLARDFRNIDPAGAKVILVEGGRRLLSAFPEDLSAYTARALERLGVEVRLGSPINRIDDDGVVVGEERIPAAVVVWGAGTKAANGAEWIGGTDDRAGRIRVAPNMSVPGHEGVYALGDVALLEQDGQPLPGLAQVAQQQGSFLGRELRRGPVARPFRFRTKGDTAVIGRHAAVYTYGRFKMRGHVAWALWAIVHVYLLIGFQQRAAVMIQWMWRYFTAERGARLIE